VYRTRGVEEYVALACESAGDWHALRAVAPLEAFAGSKFEALENRLAHDGEIDAALEAWCSDQDGRELAERLKRAGVPAAYVARPSDLYEDPQLKHRDFFKTLNHTVMGPTPYDGPVTLFSETPPAYAPAPCLGEHTHEVLSEMLGLSEAEIVRYAAAGALQ
jgi:crotonobetainyl-CoA:carnitine CoA-transferase CaiB-like acyl-CoA transferase